MLLARAYDTIIVGAGSAGCVLAARLSEDPDHNILLVEAGPNVSDDPDVEHAANWTRLPGGVYDWGHVYASGDAIGGRRIAIPQGRAVGGSSAINAMLWYRGHRSDYDAWAAEGAIGWDYAALLPYFRRSEDCARGADAWRGAGGPMRIERPNDPHPVACAMLEAAPAVGLGVIDDANGSGNEGACLADFNMRGDRRWSAARGYLLPALRRPNLTLLAGSEVSRLLVEAGRCIGIEHDVHGARRTTLACTEVILCAGAIGSPVLLLRSGIGPSADLRRLGIPVAADLPGVGANLQDHPLLMGVNFLARRPLGPTRGNGGGSMMNWRSRPGLPGPDLHAFVVQGPHASPGIAAGYGIGPECFAISPGLMRAQSRGSVRLRSADPSVDIDIQPNFLREAADVEALVRGVRMCLDLAAAPAYADLAVRPLSPPGRLGRAGLEAFVRESCSTFFHVAGTCRMGSDGASVVAPDLRVRGVVGLRVVDASVMPVLPSCNTQAPVIALAERAADVIRGAVTPEPGVTPCASC